MDQLWTETLPSPLHFCSGKALQCSSALTRTLVMTKLDRIARSMRDLMTIVDTLEKRGAPLRIIAMNLG